MGGIVADDAAWDFAENFAIAFYDKLVEVTVITLFQQIDSLVDAAITKDPALITDDGLGKAQTLAMALWLPPQLGEEILRMKLANALVTTQETGDG